MCAPSRKPDKKTAYAHHIQRLMVTGNFALIAGIDPFQVHEWYLAVYADATEWVELPNTMGMSQFADGGCWRLNPMHPAAITSIRCQITARPAIIMSKKKLARGPVPSIHFTGTLWTEIQTSFGAILG